MSDTQAELYAELALLTSSERRLSASEERKRQWLIAELAQRDDQRGIEEVRALRARWLELEHPHYESDDE
jgi:hypothetical protein